MADTRSYAETKPGATQVAVAPVIEFLGVSKSFGPKRVYDQMSLSVYAGETLAVIGGSGQGKSVCLKLMIGLLRPDAGEIRYRGNVVAKLDAAGLRDLRRKVAYVFQGGALFDSMSVLDNIGYALREHTKLSEAQITERAGYCLDMVGLESKVMGHFPASLSGGMRKRVALARSIALEPEVILYDEPTTGLDPRNITRIGRMIMKLQQELNVTSVVVTHDMPTAHKISDRIAMLHDCGFPFVGTADEMWTSQHPEVGDFIHGTLRRAYGA